MSHAGGTAGAGSYNRRCLSNQMRTLKSTPYRCEGKSYAKNKPKSYANADEEAHLPCCFRKSTNKKSTYTERKNSHPITQPSNTYCTTTPTCPPISHEGSDRKALEQMRNNGTRMLATRFSMNGTACVTAKRGRLEKWLGRAVRRYVFGGSRPRRGLWNGR